MFVHITSIHVSMGELTRLREVMRRTYLPAARQQPGFLRDYLLEQVDDPDHAELILVWENQSAFERFRGLESTDRFTRELRSVRGWRVDSQSYVIRVDPVDFPGSERV